MQSRFKYISTSLKRYTVIFVVFLLLVFTTLGFSSPSIASPQSSVQITVPQSNLTNDKINSNEIAYIDQSFSSRGLAIAEKSTDFSPETCATCTGQKCNPQPCPSGSTCRCFQGSCVPRNFPN